MNYIRALVLVALLGFPAKSATANILNRLDYDNLYNLSIRTLTLGKDINSMPSAPVSTRLCLLDLNSRIDAFYDVLKPLTSLVQLASEMVDITDEKAVIRLLSIDAPAFLRSLEGNRRGTNFVIGQCAQDGTMAVKGQELLHIFDRAASLVQSIIKKVGPRPQR